MQATGGGGGGGVGASALYTISGQTRTGSGQPIAGTTITMSGSQARVTTSDASGYYWFFSVPSGGTYHY
ncbi:MAG: carboxypeptidase regulatory-like domain-containing protein [Blastocatellales bacterium]|nr:carboxypeptidase regulatory-like domain-containing protein [Blastocatellales bacterium]